MSIFNNDKGFFQSNGKGGIKFDLGAGLANMKRKVSPKPFAGIPGVCPYTGKPLQTLQEQATGISQEAQAQGKPPVRQQNDAIQESLMNQISLTPPTGAETQNNNMFNMRKII